MRTLWGTIRVHLRAPALKAKTLSKNKDRRIVSGKIRHRDEEPDIRISGPPTTREWTATISPPIQTLGPRLIIVREQTKGKGRHGLSKGTSCESSFGRPIFFPLLMLTRRALYWRLFQAPKLLNMTPLRLLWRVCRSSYSQAIASG